MMTTILTWDERCEVHPDHQSGMVTNAMIQMRMQEEIDDLRDEIERLREALHKLASDDYECWCSLCMAGTIARAALGEGKPLEDRWDNA